MKFLKRIICLTLSLLLCFCALFVVGCGETGAKKIKLTFNYNYENSPAPIVNEVQKGEKVVSPQNPARDAYEFDGWYKTADCSGEKADFSYGATADAEYFAAWRRVAYLVKFNENYDGGKAIVSTVKISEKVAPTVDPERSGYVFSGWFTDSECNNPFDFSVAPTSDLTLYAGWEVDDGNTVKVSFEYNYGTAGTFYSTRIKKGRRVSQPATPVREGYAFVGWYKDKECTRSFSFTSVVSENISVFAGWLKESVFEAEYTDVSGILGRGYSGEFGGTDIILRDDKSLGASNGFYVSYLYSQNIRLVFEIYSDEDTDGAIIELSLSAEQADVTLSPENYTVEVNGNPLSYGEIKFEKVTEAPGKILPFRRVRIASGVKLKKGANVIKLITSNSVPMTSADGEALGTMYATAPIVDCLYVLSSANVTWREGKCFESNILDK